MHECSGLGRTCTRKCGILTGERDWEGCLTQVVRRTVEQRRGGVLLNVGLVVVQVSWGVMTDLPIEN